MHPDRSGCRPFQKARDSWRYDADRSGRDEMPREALGIPRASPGGWTARGRSGFARKFGVEGREVTIIHTTAIVHPKAELHSSVEVGPWCSIAPNVRVAKRTPLISHVVLDRHTTIGETDVIFPFSVL